MYSFLSILGRLRLSRGGLTRAALLSVGAALCVSPIAAQQMSNPLQQLMGAQGNGSSGSGLGGDSDGMGKQRTVIIEPAVPNTRPQPRSTIEQILSARAGVPLKQFGYEDLGTGRPVLLPQSGGMQENYVLGPGDEIVVSLRGQEASQYRTVVDPSGRVILPKLAPITVAGRTFGEFRRDLTAAVQRAYVATEAFASLGSVKSVRVTVGGEVNNPGLRVMTGLASALDAILVSGGIKKTGSLRNITVLRGGARIHIDLYGMLRGTVGEQIPLLTDGDRVIVNSLGPTVAIAGPVRLPAIYELAPGQPGMTAASLIMMAGGYSVRGRYDLSMIELGPDGRTHLENLSNDHALVHDSDVLLVRPTAEQTVGRATLQAGDANTFSGAYLAQATHLSDMLKAPGAMGDDPYPLFAVISRRDPTTMLRSLIAVTPSAVMAGRQDLTFQSDDIVHIFTRTEAADLTSVMKFLDPKGDNLKGDNLKSDYIDSLPSQLDDLLLRPSENNVGGNNVRDRATARAAPDARNSHFSDDQGEDRNFNSDNGMNSDNGNAGGDMGAINDGDSSGLSGGYAEVDKQNLSAVASNGLNNTENAVGSANVNAKGNSQRLLKPDPHARYRQELARLWRFAAALKVERVVAANFLEDHFVTLNGAIRGPGNYLVGPDLPLSTLVQAAGGTVGWSDKTGIERVSTVVDGTTGQSRTSVQTLNLNQAQFATAIVRPRDQYRFPEASVALLGTVALKGEVRHPGVYSIVRGERLSDLLVRAGGLTQSAFPYGAVFTRVSVAALEHEGFERAARDLEDQLTVSITQVTYGTTSNVNPALSYSAIKALVGDLRSQPAVGRITVFADPVVLATHPQSDPLLEAGDGLFIPARPSTVTVLGEVMNGGSFASGPNMTVTDYIDRAGGYSSLANKALAFVILPDGTARRVGQSWFGSEGGPLPSGSVIVVPKDVNPFNLKGFLIETTQILSQLAISAASLVILSGR